MLRDINEMIEQLPRGESNGVSDGYHTFGELYEHRVVLFIALRIDVSYVVGISTTL